MKPEYLIRFDDICPTMNWSVWAGIERALLDGGISPILAVVPDNRDERLRVDPPCADFWERVRAWQGRGWAIGVHGYQHRYVTRERGIFGWNDRSEFAGLSAAEQEDKLGRALAIFEREGVRPDVWVAPNHSFDGTTLSILRMAGVGVICDGLSVYPFVDPQGMMWIPQQLWRFRPRPLGVWTVCLHHNRWTPARLADLEQDLSKYADRITDVRAVLETYGGRRSGLLDGWFLAQRRMKRRVRATLG